MEALRMIKEPSKFYYEMKTIFSIGVALYKAKGFYQFFLIFSTALSITPLLDSLQKYLTPNFDYIAIWLILMVLDVFSGIFKHSGIWDKDAKNTLDKDVFFFKLLRKVFASGVWLVLINVVEVHSKIASEYLDMFGIGVLVSWLAWSIASNLYVITGSSFPPEWIMKRLRTANTDEDHKNKEDEK